MDEPIRLHSNGVVYDRWDFLLMTRVQVLEVVRGEFDLVGDAERQGT
jgi:hypothetical protein